MLADPSIFKDGREIIANSCCATFAKVQMTGKGFLPEFDHKVDSLFVVFGFTALIRMFAPSILIRMLAISKGFLGRMQQDCGALPNSVFKAERPELKFSVYPQLATYFYKGVLYGSVCFVCGIIGQGIANLVMTAKWNIKKSAGDTPASILWGIFIAVSWNARYQIINGLMRLIQSSPSARRLLHVALAFTVGIRFSNNMRFEDWARWSVFFIFLFILFFLSFGILV